MSERDEYRRLWGDSRPIHVPELPATDPAAIAASLNEVQRRALMGDPDRLVAPIADLLNLCARNLVTARPDGTWFLTPLGLAVRQHLMEADRG